MSDETNTENKDMERTARGEQAPATIPAGLIPAKNGALRDPKTGKVVANPPGGPTTAITAETSQAMHKLREEDRINGAYKGLLIAAGLDKDSVENRRAVKEAIPIYVAAQGRLALNEMAGRASTEAFRAVMQFADLWPDKQRAPDNTTARDIGRGIADVLCQLLQDNTHFIAENEIIDGEIVGNGNDPAPESE